jgi:hypothetical protein
VRPNKQKKRIELLNKEMKQSSNGRILLFEGGEIVRSNVTQHKNTKNTHTKRCFLIINQAESNPNYKKYVIFSRNFLRFLLFYFIGFDDVHFGNKFVGYLELARTH